MYALISGASSGIGEAMAYELAKKRYDLIVVARRLERLLILKEKIEKEYNVSVLCKQADLSDLDQVRTLFEETKALPIEIVMNSAGYGKVGFNDNIPLESDLNMISLNISSLHMMTKLYSSVIEHGVILNVGSMAAFLPTPYLASYAASKSYVVSLSRALDFEYQTQGKDVRVLVLCPGPVETEFSQVAESKNAWKGISATYCARVAMKGIEKKKRTIIPSVKMKILYFGLKVFPINLILKISFYFQKKKK